MLIKDSDAACRVKFLARNRKENHIQRRGRIPLRKKKDVSKGASFYSLSINEMYLCFTFIRNRGNV